MENWREPGQVESEKSKLAWEAYQKATASAWEAYLKVVEDALKGQGE